MESSVTGTPTLRYSTKPTRVFACSKTITLATEPSSVRLPASVDTSAVTVQACSGSGKVLIQGSSSRMRGTLLTTCDPREITGTSSRSAWAPVVGPSTRSASAGRPVCRSAATEMNSPAKKRGTLHSTWASTWWAFSLEAMSASDAPASALHASGAPARLAAITTPTASSVQGSIRASPCATVPSGSLGPSSVKRPR